MAHLNIANLLRPDCHPHAEGYVGIVRTCHALKLFLEISLSRLEVRKEFTNPSPRCEAPLRKAIRVKLH